MERTSKSRKRIWMALCALIFLISLVLSSVPVQADSGDVYTCTIHPVYRHPVTGVIEDSGGEGSYATGQGMVEGCTYSTGILELTSGGEYYLTIRLSLMDYTSNHSFTVQNVGDSGWMSTTAVITGNGTDTNGTTADICIQVPSENCVVRGTMYVEPMGRSVIWYMYPSDYTYGNSTDMNATIVTSSAISSTSGSSSGTSTQSGTSGSSTATTAKPGTSSKTSTSAAQTSTSPSPSASTSPSASQAPVLQSTITSPAQSDLTAEEGEVDTSSAVGDAQGLSLSTAEESQGDTEAEETTESSGAGTSGFLNRFLWPVLSGLVLIGAGTGAVVYLRKNWNRWGGGPDDEEDDED